MFNFAEIWVDNYVIDEGVPDWSGSFATECIASLPIKLTSDKLKRQASRRDNMTVELTRQEIIESEFTIECPICNYILIGDEPRYFIECDKCINQQTSEQEG